MTSLPGDHDRVRTLLGREPRGRYQIVVRDVAGDPVVLRNAPLLDDGTPMPTRYWLVSPDEIRRVGQLESTGGVDASEAAIDPNELAAAHLAYAAERDAEIPVEHTGPRPSGGVGGTRTGVKCLHAHWAWHLAGGDDPVGRWIAERFDSPSERAPSADTMTDTTTDTMTDPYVITVGPLEIAVIHESIVSTVPWGSRSLTDVHLVADDPPRPEALTNVLGIVTDHLDDVVRLHPSLLDIGSLTFTGPTITSLARVELGVDEPPARVDLPREAAEEIFRILATEPLADRMHNPGLPSRHADVIVATSCIVVATMRRLQLDRVDLDTSLPTTTDHDPDHDDHDDNDSTVESQASPGAD